MTVPQTELRSLRKDFFDLGRQAQSLRTLKISEKVLASNSAYCMPEASIFSFPMRIFPPLLMSSTSFWDRLGMGTVMSLLRLEPVKNQISVFASLGTGRLWERFSMSLCNSWPFREFMTLSVVLNVLQEPQQC